MRAHLTGVVAHVSEPGSQISRHGDAKSGSGTPLPSVRVGEVLAGRYRIDRLLGVGGMGFVVAAHHLHLDERVAIKFLLPEVAEIKEAVARFLREARAAIKIKSEHVARVADVGTLDDGTPFMVMEYLEGRDLSQWIRDDGPLAVPDAVELVLQACEALAEAHALGMVHRDLKPANLFAVQRADGLTAVRVLDFGISKISGSSGAAGSVGLTKTNEVMGSPQYMSPEQLLATHDTDRRSDIWSLGIVLYELIAGKLPFDGDSVPIICSKILQSPVPPLGAARPGLPVALEAAILRCLAKERQHRFDNVGELAAALVGFGPPRARFSADRVARTVASGSARASGPTPAAGLPLAAAAPAPASGPAAAAAEGPAPAAVPAAPRERTRPYPGAPQAALEGTLPLPSSTTPTGTARLPDAPSSGAGAAATPRAARPARPADNTVPIRRSGGGRAVAAGVAIAAIVAAAAGITWFALQPGADPADDASPADPPPTPAPAARGPVMPRPPAAPPAEAPSAAPVPAAAAPSAPAAAERPAPAAPAPMPPSAVPAGTPAPAASGRPRTGNKRRAPAAVAAPAPAARGAPAPAPPPGEGAGSPDLMDLANDRK